MAQRDNTPMNTAATKVRPQETEGEKKNDKSKVNETVEGEGEGGSYPRSGDVKRRKLFGAAVSASAGLCSGRCD